MRSVLRFVSANVADVDLVGTAPLQSRLQSIDLCIFVVIDVFDNE